MKLASRRHLFYLYVRETWRRTRRRFALMRFRLTRSSVQVPERLIVAPTDLRIIDPFVAEEILEGRFPLAGRVLTTNGESPFAMDMPSRAFESRLHGFTWLRHIRADKTDNACSNARAIVDQWIHMHGRRVAGVAWDLDVTAQRVISWLSHSPVVLQGVESGFYRRFMKSLAVQIRYLRRMARHSPNAEARFRARIALAMASVAMPVRASALRRAGQELDREIERQILPDGGHVSRNPRTALDLLLDLLPLRQTYVNLGHDVPAKLISGIDRMYPALRFFRHQGGDLALFNGATSTLANELMSVLRYDETSGQPFRSLPDLDYHRLSAGNTVVIVDAGCPQSVDLSHLAHAGCLSFEMSSGRHRFITNCGAPKFAADAYRQMARSTAAHSTAVLNDTSSSRLSQSEFLGPVMVAGVSAVEVSRIDAADGSDCLVASHNGYAMPFGVLHEREFRLAANGTRLAGFDRFLPIPGRSSSGNDARDVVLRFHIHPAIDIVPKSEDSILLSAPDGETWLFSVPGQVIEIAEDVFFADSSGVRQSEQLEIAFSAASIAEIRWELARQK